MHKFIFPQAPVKWFCLFYISNYLNWIPTIIIFIVFQNLHLNKTCIERMIICGSWFGRSFLLVNFFFVSCWFVANTTKCILRFHTLDHLYQSSWMNIYIHLFLIISLTSTWFFGPLKAEKSNRITNCEICLLSAINLPREKDFLNRIKYLNIILMRILFQLNVVFIDISIGEYQISFSNNLSYKNYKQGQDEEKNMNKNFSRI